MTFVRDDYGGNTLAGFTDAITIVAGGNLGETWTAQPAATTELFGTTSNRNVFEDNVAGTEVFTVNVVTAGASFSTVLEVQVSGDNGATWVDPCGSPGGADSPIGSTGLKITNCGLVNSVICCSNLMRIVGKNGNGVASPSFGLITVTWLSEAQSTFTGYYVPLPTTTGFNIGFFTTYVVPAIFGPMQETVSWIAIECVKGGNTC